MINLFRRLFGLKFDTPRKIKNYNLNVTEVRDSDFKNDLPGIFNFTVGILNMTLKIQVGAMADTLASYL